MTTNDRFRGALLGLAVGDAVGMPFEFRAPGTFEPVIDMVGSGSFGLAAGKWTDDTSMALCLADSRLETRGFDPLDQITRYVRWWGSRYRGSTGYCHIFETFLPRLRKLGVSDKQINTMMVLNPARALSIN